MPISCSVEFECKIMSHLSNTVGPRSWESAWPKSCSEMDRVSLEDPGWETRLEFRVAGPDNLVFVRVIS
jgi:hypothetical protein